MPGTTDPRDAAPARSPDDLRQEARRRREEARRLLPRLRAQAAERVRRVLGRRPPRDHRRERRLAALAALLLLLLLLRCDEAKGPPAIASPRVPTIAAKPSPPPTRRPRPGPLDGTLERQRRPGYDLAGRGAPDWTDDFRLQVSARSPRLSRCFVGATSTGSLRWTVSIDAASGRVGDHELEPVAQSADLTRDQRECVTRVLSNPAYRLNAPPHEALPERVSLVIEF